MEFTNSRGVPEKNLTSLRLLFREAGITKTQCFSLGTEPTHILAQGLHVILLNNTTQMPKMTFTRPSFTTRFLGLDGGSHKSQPKSGNHTGER